MSSKPERLRIFRSLSARLTVFYTALFLLSLSAVFVAVYMLIARTIREREREVLEVRAAEYANVLQQGGIAAGKAQTGAARGKGLCNRPADAAAGAGDQHMLAGESAGLCLGCGLHCHPMPPSDIILSIK